MTELNNEIELQLSSDKSENEVFKSLEKLFSYQGIFFSEHPMNKEVFFFGIKTINEIVLSHGVDFSFSSDSHLDINTYKFKVLEKEITVTFHFEQKTFLIEGI